MEEVDLNYLSHAHLFADFVAQLKKDFEGAGLEAEFTVGLPQDFFEIKRILLNNIPFNNATTVSALLYRIDISELQLSNYSNNNKQLSFEEVLAELTIKRILQKIILRRTFSK
jgi:hypothetical protein